MVLDRATEEQIKEFVLQKPRIIQEVARHINKTWRTADSYVEKISKETGSIATRTLRGGTRGAIKIAYWAGQVAQTSNQTQTRLLSKIKHGTEIIDFSPFDIYQYIDPEKRSSFIEEQSDNPGIIRQDLFGTIKKAERQILIFSGDFSWMNLKQGKEKFPDLLRKLVQKGISVKVLTKVDIATMKNVQHALEINNEIGRDLIEIRHCEQPLRSVIVDDKIVKFKEMKNIEDFSKKLKKRTFIFYEIRDVDWIEWLKNVFFDLFSCSIDAKKRIENLKSIQT